MRTAPTILLVIGDDGIATIPCGIPDAMPFITRTVPNRLSEEILDLIAAYPKARLILCADNLAQDYRCDTVPRLNFLDRARLIDRRLKQNFPQARLTAQRAFRHDSHRILLVGLQENNPIFAWEERLRDRLPTLCLLPIEGAPLLTRLMPEAAQSWAMMVSRQKTGGLRQIVTYRGNLVFTRLTPLPSVGEETETAARDIRASLDYLTRYGLPTSKDLALLLLWPESASGTTAFADMPLRLIRFLSPFDAAQKLALPFAPPPAALDSDLLFAAQILTRRPVLGLMMSSTRIQRRHQILQFWGLRLAVGALIAVIGLTLAQAGDLISTLSKTHKDLSALTESRQTLAETQQQAAPETAPLGKLRAAVARKHIYEEQTPLPWHGLRELTLGLGKPLRLEGVTWTQVDSSAPEIFTLSFTVLTDGAKPERADAQAVFDTAAARIAHAMPDYQISVTKPPYPARPQDSVAPDTSQKMDAPTTEITLQRPGQRGTHE